MKPKRLLLSCSLIVALGGGGCSEDAAPPVGRPYQGGVTVVQGGQKDSLPLAAGYPLLELSTRFLLQLRGTLAGTTHDVTVLVDPIEAPPARYDFPQDDAVLQLSVARDGVPVSTGVAAGFLQVGARDGAGATAGNAVVSLTLSDGGNLPMLEIDLVFGP